VTTYTFGEPLNGNPAFVQYIERAVPDSNYYRVTHANDGVPQIPPTLLGYAHHGPEFWQREAGRNTAATTFACGKQSRVSTSAILLRRSEYANAIRPATQRRISEPTRSTGPI
jgi:hypothetical protein